MSNPSMKLEIIGSNSRRNGKTTALVDLALMNAAHGQHVEFWCANHAMRDHAMSVARKRLWVLAHHRPVLRQIEHAIVFPASDQGRVDFLIAKHLPGYRPNPDVTLEDCEEDLNNKGFMSIYNEARRLQEN